MPNVSIGKNCIIAAGSIVTKNIPDNEVWGGVPAKFITSIEEYSNKLYKINMSYPWHGKPEDDTIENRVRFFWNNP